MSRGRAAAAGLLVALACAHAPPARRLEAQNALAWRAVDPDARRGELLLLGSVHLAREPLELGPALEAELRRAEALVVESDVSRLTDADHLALLNQWAFLPGPPDLIARSSPATRDALAAWSARYGIDTEPLRLLRPWFAALTLEALTLEREGYDPEYGVDVRLLERARAARVPIEELEAPHESFARLNGLPAQVQDQLLQRTALDASGEALARLIAAWSAGDERALAELVFAERATRPELEPLYAALFDARNLRMAERLLARSADGHRRLVVVGAAHLLGERGIPALLAEAGLRVERWPGAARAPL